MPLGVGRGQNLGLTDFAIFGFCCHRGHPCFTNTCLVVFIRSGIHIVFALNGKETVSISLQSQLQVPRYDVLSINNPEFENYLGHMYLAELEIKDTTESITSSSYLDLLLQIGRDCQLHTSIYGKRDDFNFHITNFPFLSSNIRSYISAYTIHSGLLLV